LGIAQREIHAKRTPDTGMTQRRKATPKEVKTLGDRLKKARMERGMTQRQVSAITDIPRGRLQEIERDERVPSPEDWQRLTDAVGM